MKDKEIEVTLYELSRPSMYAWMASLREKVPRLYFLSDEDVGNLLTRPLNETIADIVPGLFSGAKAELGDDGIHVHGLHGDHDSIRFKTPVPLGVFKDSEQHEANHNNAVAVLQGIEKRMHETIAAEIKDCDSGVHHNICGIVELAVQEKGCTDGIEGCMK